MIGDTYYNVWNLAKDRWTLAAWNGMPINQKPQDPQPLSKSSAEAFCNWLKLAPPSSRNQYEVRPIVASTAQSSVAAMTQYYNVWNRHARRWTNASGHPGYCNGSDNPHNPKPLTLENAKKFLSALGSNALGEYEVRAIDSNDGISSIELKDLKPVHDPKAPAINDHVCPHCQNDRVSKSEPSCWRCGGKL